MEGTLNQAGFPRPHQLLERFTPYRQGWRRLAFEAEPVDHFDQPLDPHVGTLAARHKIGRCIRAERQPALFGMNLDQFGDHGVVGGTDFEVQRRAQPRGEIGQRDPPVALAAPADQQQRGAAFLGRSEERRVGKECRL